MGWVGALAIYGAGLATANAGWGFISQRAKRRDDRRSASSRAIAGIVDFLWKIEPNAFVGGIGRDRMEEAIGHHADAWDIVRHDLEALRVADGRPPVDVTAVAAITALNDAFASVVLALRDRGGGAVTDWDRLNAKYAAAKTAADELKQAVLA